MGARASAQHHLKAPSGDACDHYHRYQEDIALLAQLGFNAYRFSTEWARIEPEEGEFSHAELEHYRRMLATCHEHGIKPVVTFHHFTSPRWLIRQGGWLDEKTPESYVPSYFHIDTLYSSFKAATIWQAR